MKVLVDTLVWIDHFRRKDPLLVELLDAVQVVSHSAVIGELACGNLRERARICSAFHRYLTHAPRKHCTWWSVTGSGDAG